jgi:AcrR family transcriptional regulator
MYTQLIAYLTVGKGGALMSTLQSIKQEALALFAQNGYEATTLNEIASQVGIKKPSLYVYFSSKQELFLSVFDDLLQEYQSAVQQMVEEAEKAEPDQQLLILFKKYILWFANERTKSQFWNRALLFPPADVKDEIFRRISNVELQFLQKEAEIIERLMASGVIRKGEKDEVLLSIRSLRSGLLSAFLVNPDMEQEKIDKVWERFWLGNRGGGNFYKSD